MTDNALSEKLVIDGAQAISKVLMERILGRLVMKDSRMDARLLI